MLLIIKPGNITSKGQLYTATYLDRVLCSSRQPFYDAARVLLGEGVPAETILEARHSRSCGIDMRSTVGYAALWSISDDVHGRMNRHAWAPYRPAGQ